VPIRSKHLEPDGTLIIGFGKKIRVMLGGLTHITGTKSLLDVKDDKGFGWGAIHEVAAATANSVYTINDRVLTNVVVACDASHVWIPHGFYFKFVGGTGAGVNLIYEEEDDI